MPGGSNAAYLTFEDLGQSLKSLNTHFTEFNRVGKVNQPLLLETSANLEKLGLDTDLFAQNLTLANKALGFRAFQNMFNGKKNYLVLPNI